MRPLACLPDPIGTTLLHAVLDPPERAAAAWRSARPHIDVSTSAPHVELHRFLPLAHRNLASVDIDETDRSHLQARYAETLVRNEARVATTARWAALLALGGVPATVVKGIPLTLRDYADLGVRPMADIDILFPPGLSDRGLDLLEASGWTDPGGHTRETLSTLYHGSARWHPEGGGIIDAHWQLAGFLPPDFEPRLEEIQVGDHVMTTLDRTDTLVHVCLHGVWNGSNATARWVADAVTVARAADAAGTPIDASRIVDIAERHGLGSILGGALQHVRDEHAAPLPEGLVEALLAQRVSWRVRHRQRVVTAPLGGRERVTGLAHLRAYWAYTRWSWTDSHAVRTLPAFLTELWGLDSPRQLPGALVKRPLRRVTRRRP